MILPTIKLHLAPIASIGDPMASDTTSRPIMYNTFSFIVLYQDKLTTDIKPTVGYSIPDEIPTTCFQLCELV